MAGRAAQWIPSLGPESRPLSPSAGFSPAPEKPTDTCVSDPPETGNSHGGWGGVAPHTARDTESWTLFSDSDPASPGPSGGDPAGLPECQHPALPLAERRRGGPEQGAGRSELQLARSKRANNYRQNLQKRLQIKAPQPVIRKRLPTSVPGGHSPVPLSGSCRSGKTRGHSIHRTAGRGLRSRNSTMRTSGQVGDEQTGGGVRLTRTCSASPVHAATHPCTWCLTRAHGGPVSGSTPPPQAALASSVHV